MVWLFVNIDTQSMWGVEVLMKYYGYLYFFFLLTSIVFRSPVFKLIDIYEK